MEPAAGARDFIATGQAYDSFMGRYSLPLAAEFASFAGAVPGQRALDVGCGPGALTGELLRRLGGGAVSACDPSASFVSACAERHPGADVRLGAAEQLPFDDQSFDLVLAQLVLHFVTDPARAASEIHQSDRQQRDSSSVCLGLCPRDAIAARILGCRTQSRSAGPGRVACDEFRRNR